MTSVAELGDWVRERLPELLAEHQVPAAAVAIRAGDEVVDAAAGVLSTATGVEATPDTVFQIGSITKVWTATLVMQLVDEGGVDLDAPVRRYLPEFRIADERAAAGVTVRQLLCHVAGFEGDIFVETGVGDDCVAKYLDVLHDVTQLFEPGELFSYNNAAFCVLGRLVEVLREKIYDDCLRDQLFSPLKLTHAANTPYEAILHRAAVGHITPQRGAAPRPAPAWARLRSNAPAGSMLAMRARDLLTFAQLHLAGGVTADGERLLRAESVRAMQQRQIELPEVGFGDAWGLGWELYDLPGGTVIGHDGATIGQSAFLRAVPGPDVSVALLTNGGRPFQVYAEIVGRVLRDLAGIELPPWPVPGPDAKPPADAARYVGTYSSSMCTSVVSQDGDGRVWLERTYTGDDAEEIGDTPYTSELVAWRDDTLLPVEADHGLHQPHAFIGDDGRGHARFLHTGRADPRVPGS